MEPGDVTDALAAFAEAWLRQDPQRRPPLADLLAAHPEAAAQLTEALLEGELARPAPPPAADAPAATGGREQIGPYSIVRLIGRGGQAAVFEAVDRRLGRRVALKVLRGDVFRSTAAEQRFRAEAATTSRLDHSGICPVFEIGQTDDLLYLAMRFVAGETLAQHIGAASSRVAAGQRYELALTPHDQAEPVARAARRVRPWVPTMLLLESAARALHAAHQAGIAHRDLKPANIMVQPDGSAVLLDFGLAADLRRDGEALTRTGDVFGTPAYMPPEQCRDARSADHRSDIWALGAVWFEALTGKPVIDAPTTEGKLRQILSGQLPQLQRRMRRLPVEFAVIVQRAMDPDPERRYASAEAFADDLQRLRESRPILARPPGLALRMQRWLQRNPLLAALVVVTCVGGVTAEYLRRTARAAARDGEFLAAPQLLAELRVGAEGLRPVREHRAAAQAWLQQARGLKERRAALAQRLAELRRDAMQPTAAEVADLQARHPASAQLALLQAIDASAEAGYGRPDQVAELLAQAPARAEEQQRLREQLAMLRPFRFALADEQVLHDTIAAFLVDLDQFAGGDGPVASVQRELDELAAEAPADWQAAITAIAASPRYGGLHLGAQGGLSPLRCNPYSGLWEFLHVRSGAPPRWRDDGSVVIEEGTGIVLALVPGGRYWIGSQGTDATAPYYNAKLRADQDYLVELPLEPYFLAVHEVTQAQWQRLGGGTPSTYWPGSAGRAGDYGVSRTNPVENVSWDSAAAVLAQSGLELPTEAQWEVAARGGTTTELWCGTEPQAVAAAENLFDGRANEMGIQSRVEPLPWNDHWAVHAPVASLRPNPLGFHDMLGNVMEWCRDTQAWPNHHLMRRGDGLWLSPPDAKHAMRGGCFTTNLEFGLLHVRPASADRGYHAGVRAARRVE